MAAPAPPTARATRRTTPAAPATPTAATAEAEATASPTMAAVGGLARMAAPAATAGQRSGRGHLCGQRRHPDDSGYTDFRRWSSRRRLAGTAQSRAKAPSSLPGSAGSAGTGQGAGIFLSGVRANIGVSSGNLIYANTIAGTGLNIGGVTTAINKTGAGTLTLSAVNTFPGNVNISAGTLSVAGTANLGNLANAVVMSNGATFAVTATSTFANGHAFKIAGSSASRHCRRDHDDASGYRFGQRLLRQPGQDQYRHAAAVGD